MARDTYSNNELLSRVVALEASLTSLGKVLDERDLRYDQRSKSQDTAVSAALSTSKEAMVIAAAATEKRLDALNELRKMAEDQGREFARKTETDLIIGGLGRRLENLETTVNSSASRGSGMRDAWGYVLAAATVVVAIVFELFRK
jgi:predicted RecB family endonuclease